MPILNDVLAGLVHKDRITARDVIDVRRAIYPDMAISPDEAEALFAINDTAGSACLEWRQLFVEALTDYIVRQQRPSGYVNAVQGRWLAERITQDGKVKTQTELDLLIHVLETAAQAPSALSHLALDQVAAFALTPERRNGDGPALTSEEVRRLRSLLYAIAGDGEPGAVSRREAQLLFALNAAARGRPNHSSWRDLFIQAIGASLLAATTHKGHDQREAQRLRTWLETPTDGVGGVLAKVTRFDFAEGWKSLREEDLATLDCRRDEAAIAAAEALTDDEAAWLTRQIGRGGVFDDNEVALVQFVARQASSLPPALRDLVEQVQRQTNMVAALGEAPAFGRHI